MVCPDRALAWTAGGLLYAAVVALRWRVQGWGRGVWPGLLAGSIPVVMTLLLQEQSPGRHEALPKVHGSRLTIFEGREEAFDLTLP